MVCGYGEDCTNWTRSHNVTHPHGVHDLTELILTTNHYGEVQTNKQTTEKEKKRGDRERYTDNRKKKRGNTDGHTDKECCEPSMLGQMRHVGTCEYCENRLLGWKYQN